MNDIGVNTATNHGHSHTKDKCWDIVKLANWQPRKKSERRGYHDQSNQDKPRNSGISAPFTKEKIEQIEQYCRLISQNSLNLSASSNIGSCSVTQYHDVGVDEAPYTLRKSKGASKATPKSARTSKATSSTPNRSSKAATSKSRGKRPIGTSTTFNLVDEEDEFNFDEESEEENYAERVQFRMKKLVSILTKKKMKTDFRLCFSSFRN
ncbi:uncharacterized protein [Primulina eburnea]|uniref:uncharacterized protein n=1 Tax=Primulina eburnea TaxID=1245227 RepID=UPI003C6C8047